MTHRLEDEWRRNTRPRQQVLRALREAELPLTAQEISSRAEASLPSVYRILGSLVRQGVASEVPDSNGTDARRGRRYALCSREGHHHHFVCRSCQTVIEVASEELERALVHLEATTGLCIEEHELALRGRCASCRL